MNNNYDDIIKLNRPISKKHKPMSMISRAAQFSAFAALTGYDKLIDETGRLTDERVELNEDKIVDINNLLVYLINNKTSEADFTYFVKDEKKNGGKYCEIRGFISKVDSDKQLIYLNNKEHIKIEDIVDIELVH